ncbi:MAG: UDP-N-acetylenolpyruvoylglucosamine reductase [Patescibacteria group bacterium]|nr:MAG: UDP-N-acetylenolpyruvoylglucosamine reductase [Patescibacteria group bacterium]
MSELLAKLQSQFPQLEFKEQYPLAQHTTVKIGGPAELYCETKNSQDFIALVSFMRKNNLPLTLLGWGANTLISDSGITGLVVRNTSQTITILDSEGHTTRTFNQQEQERIAARWQSDSQKGTFTYEFSDLDYDESEAERVLVELDSGVSLPYAINILIQQGITGLQWYSRIPATVGGAIYNNIHGGTHFISEVIKSIAVIDEQGKSRVLDKSELKAGYDVSRFHETDETIVSAVFSLYKGDTQKAAYVAREWAVRKAIQPQRSLGCVFQNISNEVKDKLGYPTTSVGYIVEHVLNKKGFQIGDAKISEKHGAFIENVGNATAKEYLEVIRTVISQTERKTGVKLKPEIFFLGFKKSELAGIV